MCQIVEETNKVFMLAKLKMLKIEERQIWKAVSESER